MIENIRLFLEPLQQLPNWIAFLLILYVPTIMGYVSYRLIKNIGNIIKTEHLFTLEKLNRKSWTNR